MSFSAIMIVTSKNYKELLGMTKKKQKFKEKMYPSFEGIFIANYKITPKL